jgi:hypothetical protein
VSPRPPKPIPVYLESASKRVFACALDWPGWCRSGKSDEAALEALGASAPRYAAVAAEGGVRFPATAGYAFVVVERLTGGGATDFGIPDKTAAADSQPLSAKQAQRLAALVRASWVVFDRVVAGAPAELRKGPRGGGRDRDAVVDHVLGAEAAYARKLAIKHAPPSADDRAAVEELRDAIAGALEAARAGTPAYEKGWLPRYAARRIAWHVLDHSWEIEDRSER